LHCTHSGIKYAVLTAKHVAGFCLWDSKYTTYDVMNPQCPYQQDLLAQFIKSFKSRGLKVGLYYCWRHPGFGDPNPRVMVVGLAGLLFIPWSAWIDRHRVFR